MAIIIPFVKMTDVSSILERLRLKPKDVLTPTEIQEIFLNLNVEEISKLCRTSNKFNTVCKRESLWRNKVMSEYGVDEPLRRKTWRETARIFFISNMINLGKRWVNGMTYKELLEEADSRGQESLLYLHSLKNDYLHEALDIKDDTDILMFFIYPDEIHDKLLDDYGIDTDDENIVEVTKILTKELEVIATVISVRVRSYPDLPLPDDFHGNIPWPGLRFTGEYTGTVRKNTDAFSVIIDDLFDYIPYLVNFSDMSHQRLDDMIYAYM